MRREILSLIAGLGLCLVAGAAASAGPRIPPTQNGRPPPAPVAYNGRPTYWRTVVVGCVKNGLLIPLAAPYYVTMNLDQFVGSRGVEIVGASRKVRRAVPRS